jgi:non-ribosomal peptide synthetase component F
MAGPTERIDQLSPTKRALLASMLGGQQPVRAAASPIEARDDDAPAPASFAQRRLWFLDQLASGRTTYNNAHLICFGGVLDVDLLRRCFEQIVQRHEPLRTAFIEMDGEPVLDVRASLPIDMPVVDLVELDESARPAELERIALAEAQVPFDLNRAPLWRCRLVRLAEHEHALVYVVHHIISDRWSVGVLVQELAALYEANGAGHPSPLPDLKLRYSDYAAWQRRQLDTDHQQSQLGYWHKLLGIRPPVLELPTDRPRPPVSSSRGHRQTLSLPAGLVGRLKALARDQNTTLFMVMLAVFEVLIHRHSRQGEFVVTTPVAGRRHLDLEPLIGLFINLLPILARVNSADSFGRLLSETRSATIEALANADVPFEQLVEQAQMQRDLGRMPFGQAAFNFHNVPMPSANSGGLKIEVSDVEVIAARFELAATIHPDGDALVAWFDHNTDLFDDATIARMADHYRRLLEAVVEDPTRPVADLPMLTDAERNRLLVEWNDTAVAYPSDDCISRLFEQRADLAPHAEALVCGDERVTYEQLNRRANRLAHHLQTLGVGADVLVGVCLPRTADLPVALMGVLKAGGAYLPLDPAYPRSRLEFMLEDSGAPVLVTDSRLASTFACDHTRVVCVDRDAELLRRQPDANPPCSADADSLAYVIYTSGSTGKPKGVAIEHHGPVALIEWGREMFGLRRLAGTLFSTSVCFDISVFELFAPLACGAKVILVGSLLDLPTCGARDEVRRGDVRAGGAVGDVPVAGHGGPAPVGTHRGADRRAGPGRARPAVLRAARGRPRVRPVRPDGGYGVVDVRPDPRKRSFAAVDRPPPARPQSPRTRRRPAADCAWCAG